jgi:predicted DNA-binding protein
MAEDERKPRAVSVREDTDRLIEALASHLGKTKAGVVRAAVERLAQAELPNPDFRRKETR